VEEQHGGVVFAASEVGVANAPAAPDPVALGAEGWGDRGFKFCHVLLPELSCRSGFFHAGYIDIVKRLPLPGCIYEPFAMSLCINPHCADPDRSENEVQQFCQSCRSELILQGRYRVMRLMSDKSGFGNVYEAFERKVPKLLKVLKEEYSDNPKAVNLFRQEAAVLSQLSHPGVPMVEADGYFQYLPHKSQKPLHCLVMEKIDGLNLREWMRQQGHNPISEKQALNWLKQLVDVLHLVHQKNYFHRDIKPENIMLRSTGQIVLVDFGAVREMTLTYLEQVGKTGGITRISSAGYTPPEQEKGQAVPQSDFYALGCTLIYLLTGNQPTDVGMYDYFNNELTWRQYAPHLSPAFADFIDRLVANRVSDRPQDTQEILDTLPGLVGAGSASFFPQAVPQATPSTIVNEMVRELNQNGIPNQTVNQSAIAWRIRKRWMAGCAIVLTALAAGSYGLKKNYHTQIIQAIYPEQVTISNSRELTGHEGFVNCLALSPDGKTLFSGSADRTIRSWDFETGQALQVLTGHTGFVNAIAVTPDGQTVISGGTDKAIRLWNLATGKEVRTLQGHEGFINSLSISPDGKLLASGSADKTIKIWDLATGITVRTLTGHQGYVNSLIFSQDGKSLFSSSADKTIQQWDVATGAKGRTFMGHTSFVNGLAVTADGNTLISASADQTIRIWDVLGVAETRVLRGHTSFVNAIVLKPDGKFLVSGGGDQTFRIWDMETGREKQTFRGYGKDVNYFVVNPSWNAIATGSGLNTIKIWQFQK
jgi:WD40 repeat protein